MMYLSVTVCTAQYRYIPVCSWYVLVCPSTYQYVPVQTSLYSHTMNYEDVMSVHISIDLYVLEHTRKIHSKLIQK
jgi:hypothetical protein